MNVHDWKLLLIHLVRDIGEIKAQLMFSER